MWRDELLLWSLPFNLGTKTQLLIKYLSVYWRKISVILKLNCQNAVNNHYDYITILKLPESLFKNLIFVVANIGCTKPVSIPRDKQKRDLIIKQH